MTPGSDQAPPMNTTGPARNGPARNDPARNDPARKGAARKGAAYDPDALPLRLSFWQDLDFGGATGLVRIRLRPVVNLADGESPVISVITPEDADTAFTLEFIGGDGTVLHGVVERVDVGPFTGTGTQVRNRLAFLARSVVRTIPRRYRLAPSSGKGQPQGTQVIVQCQRAEDRPVKTGRKVVGFVSQWTFTASTPDQDIMTGIVNGIDLTPFTATRDRFAQRLLRWEDAVISAGGRPIDLSLPRPSSNRRSSSLPPRRCEYRIPPGTPENPVRPGEIAQERTCGKALDPRAKGRFCTNHREKQPGQFERGTRPPSWWMSGDVIERDYTPRVNRAMLDSRKLFLQLPLGEQQRIVREQETRLAAFRAAMRSGPALGGVPSGDALAPALAPTLASLLALAGVPGTGDGLAVSPDRPDRDAMPLELRSLLAAIEGHVEALRCILQRVTSRND